jgi:hypothetical protein
VSARKPARTDRLVTDRGHGLCLRPVPPWPPYRHKTLCCVNCGWPVRETGGGSTLRRFVHVTQHELAEAATAGRELTDEDRAECAEEAAWKRREDQL